MGIEDHPTLMNNLEVNYKWDGNVLDSSPNARHGAPTGIAYIDGKLGQAADFQEFNDKIAITGYKGVTGTLARTVSMWFKCNGLPERDSNTLISWGANGFENVFQIKIKSSVGNPRGVVQVLNDPAYNRRGPTYVCNNDWHHIVVAVPAVAKVTDAKIYIDGVEDTPYTDVIPGVLDDFDTGDTFDVVIGNWFTAGAHSIYKGAIDEVGIWSRELSAGEVSDLWNGGVGIIWEAAVSVAFTNFPKDLSINVSHRVKASVTITCETAILDTIIMANGKPIYVNGVFSPDFWGTVLFENSDKKVTVYFRPVVYWEASKQYDIGVWVKQTGGGAQEDTDVWDFTTGAYRSHCFEDQSVAISAMDQAIMDGYASSSSERVRQALMRVSTKTVESFIQARTIIYLSTMTELKTILAGVLDFSLVEDLRLCDRRSVIDMHADLRRYLPLARHAVDELKLKEEAKRLLKDYLDSSSPIYVVNAVAVVVVLATRGLNL